MNIEEVKKELTKDIISIFNFLDHRENRYKRSVLKSRKFPFFFEPYFYRSPRKNEWIIIIEVPNRKATTSDLCKITFVCLLNQSNGYYAFMPSWINDEMVLNAYAPHFFSRFAERFEVDLNGKELIARFFKYNASYVFDLKMVPVQGGKIVEVAGSVKEGVCLGLEMNGGVFFKTFITYEMLKGEQVEKYTSNEKLRKEIHEKSEIEY